jgi:small-conductance mechanosensitive channel
MRNQGICLVLIMFFLSGLTFAEETTAKKCHKIIYAGVEISCFQNGIGPFSVNERIEAIKLRISRLSKSRTFDPDNVVVSSQENSTEISAEDTVLATIRDQDVDTSVATNRQEMAELMASNIRKAIHSDRTLTSPKALLWAAGYTALATIGLILILMLFSRLFPKIYAIIRSNEGRIIRSIKIQSYELLNSARIISFLLWLAQATRVILTVITFYIYIPLVLSFFPLTANWAPKLYGYIVNPLHTIFNVIIAYIPNLFFVIAIALVTRYLMKLVRFFFQEIELGSLEIQGFFKEWAEPTYKLIRVLIIAFAFIMAFPYLPGSDSPAFQGVSVFLGILLSLGSSSAVANIVAGVVITYMRPFKLGDRVKIADTMGDVIEKTLLVTRIRSIKNVDVTIPNSMVLGSHIINYSSMAQSEGLVLNTTITIGYDAPWRKIHELLKEAAKRTELISNEREAFVLQTALNDFYVSYELNAYTCHPNKMALIYSQLHQNIQDCFNEAGVEIMSPHYSTLRDGNETTTPENYRSPDYEASKFRVTQL